MSWLALDIGGANLKAADGLGFAVARPFPLWQRPQALAGEIARLLADAPAAERIAVTMTGELADCFGTKREGVAAIARAASEAAAGRALAIYLTDGSLVPLEEAITRPLEAAASNWHALARFAGRYAPGGSALLIDIGSTTADLIPLAGGVPAAQGRTDPERMAAGELVYTGVIRSPVCAVSRWLPWRGGRVPTAQELFATTWDAYLVLGDLEEEPGSVHTADGRPATRGAARDRLARCICADREVFSEQDALCAARRIAEDQLEGLCEAAGRLVRRMGSPPGTMIVCGQGEFLGRRLVERLGIVSSVVSLHETLGPILSRCAPAHALAVLARES
ncbi:MAG: hydantoinase/oxoprolinase family protein [Pirellulales bacterium]